MRVKGSDTGSYRYAKEACKVSFLSPVDVTAGQLRSRLRTPGQHTCEVWRLQSREL